MKFDAPFPSIVLVLNSIVGLGLVLQQIPFEVMLFPPSEVIIPPLLGLAVSGLEIKTVETTGN